MKNSVEKRITKLLAENLYLQGDITEEEIGDRNLVEKKLTEIVQKQGGFYVAVDHRDDILKHAKYFIDIGNKKMAIVMFAMFFEHAINGVISSVLESDGFSKKTKNEVLRNASLKAKVSWVLELLHLPKFNETHRKSIMQIADERNAFVHYKFNVQFTGNEKRDDHVDRLIEIAKKSVKYMKYYNTRIEFDGKKQSVTKNMSKW